MIIALLLLYVQILEISLDFGLVERPVLPIFINPHEKQIGLLLPF